MPWSAYLCSSDRLPWCGSKSTGASWCLAPCKYADPPAGARWSRLSTTFATVCRACPSTMQSRLCLGSGGSTALQHTSLPPMLAQQAGRTPAQARCAAHSPSMKQRSLCPSASRQPPSSRCACLACRACSLASCATAQRCGVRCKPGRPWLRWRARSSATACRFRRT